MPKTYDEVKNDDSFSISLVKLTGRKIVDIKGYLTDEFDEIVFKVCRVLLDDGTVIYCEGEHDLPYLVGLSDEDMKNVWKTDPDTKEDMEAMDE